MKRKISLSIVLMSILGLGIVVALTSFVFAGTNTSESDHLKSHFIFREIGDQLLRSSGDFTSVVPPLIEKTDSRYEFSFIKPFALIPDSLADITKRIMNRSAFKEAYFVSVIDPQTKQVVYGFSSAQLATGKVSCIGRAYKSKPYTLSFLVVTGKEPGVKRTAIAALAAILFAMMLITKWGFSINKYRGGAREHTGNLNPASAALSEINYNEGLLNETPAHGRHQHQPGQIVTTPLVSSPIVSIGKFSFLPNEQSLHLRDDKLPLTAKETKLLGIFSSRPNEFITREQLLKEGWEDEGVITTRSLDMYISKLRKKLSGDDQVTITNLHGYGYKLNC